MAIIYGTSIFQTPLGPSELNMLYCAYNGYYIGTSIFQTPLGPSELNMLYCAYNGYYIGTSIFQTPLGPSELNMLYCAYNGYYLWNLHIPDTIGTVHTMAIIYNYSIFQTPLGLCIQWLLFIITVEPPYSRHHWDCAYNGYYL